MAWERGNFERGLILLKEGFDLDPVCCELALVWREGDEYNVLPAWIIRHFREYLDWRNLKVVMFLTRQECGWLLDMVKKGIEQ